MTPEYELSGVPEPFAMEEQVSLPAAWKFTTTSTVSLEVAVNVPVVIVVAPVILAVWFDAAVMRVAPMVPKVSVKVVVPLSR
jgi:hypothetical protein